MGDGILESSTVLLLLLPTPWSLWNLIHFLPGGHCEFYHSFDMPLTNHVAFRQVFGDVVDEHSDNEPDDAAASSTLASRMKLQAANKRAAAAATIANASAPTGVEVSEGTEHRSVLEDRTNA